MTFRSLFVSLMLLALPLLAQTPPQAAPAPVEGSHTYVPADFAQFAPQTALDMLNRVPGFAIKQEEDARGLGQATGNVVINGQRPSSKADTLQTILARIPASRVARVEVGPGDLLIIPSNWIHAFRQLGDEDVVFYEAFAPIRLEYLVGFKGPDPSLGMMHASFDASGESERKL